MTSLNPALARLSSRPLAIAPRALDGLLAAGASSDMRSAIPLGVRDANPASPRDFIMTNGGIAVVPVLGPLVTRSDWLTALFGASDYGQIGRAVEAALAEPSTRAVLFELDSPGGEVGGLFDLVDRLVALRDAAQKPLWAVANESALSAAFAIASVADRLYVTRTAEIGSVGVVAVHVDESAADGMAGLKWTLIHAGARKVDGNVHEPLSGAAFSSIQADVDALHAALVGLVARNRNLPPEAVRATEAAIYRGQRGIDAGFADRLGTLDQALADLAMTLDPSPKTISAPQRAFTHQPPRRKPDMITQTSTDAPAGGAPADGAEIPDPEISETSEPIPASPVAPAASLEASTENAAERLRAEYAEIAAIAAQAGRLGITVDAADAMKKGVAPHALRRSVLDALAARADASALVAAAPQPAGSTISGGGDSPIVRRARERASATHS